MSRGSCDACGLMGASDVSEHTGVHEASICSKCEQLMVSDMQAAIEWDDLDIATTRD